MRFELTTPTLAKLVSAVYSMALHGTTSFCTEAYCLALHVTELS